MNYKVLYDENKELPDGTFVYRIEAIEDSIHATTGAKGGWIADPGNLLGNAWVDGEAMVYGKATVTDDALVSGNALIYGSAIVSENGKVSGDAQVYGKGRVLLEAEVQGNCIVKSSATITGDAILKSDCVVGGNAHVEGGVWTKTPFHNKHLRYPFTHCKPGYIRIDCSLFTFKHWLYNFHIIANKWNAIGSAERFFWAWYSVVPTEDIEPLILGLFANPVSDSTVMKVILARHKLWLIEQGKEDYTDQYKF